MKIRQLSLFLENRPGQLRAPCQALGAAGLDILTMSLADTQQFGILRLVVKDWARAKQVLEAAGQVVNVTELLALDVPDRAGGLAEVLEVFERTGLGVEYMYPFTLRERGQRATLLVRVEDPDRAAGLLAAAGVALVPAEELYRRAGA
ncbi:MAG TPA: amino acid-binding protein [Anaeromyxobacteraceae bacterium]|nr:amino acid-binding protein [Anaeromyxobacteraceae bacterium]